MRLGVLAASALGSLVAFGLAAEELEMRALNGPRGDVAALILGGTDGGSLRAAAMAFSECGPEAGSGSASFWVEVEAASLLEAVAASADGEPPASIRLELYAYAMTREGEIAASLAEWVRVRLDALEDRRSGGVKLPARVSLEPGEYQVRVLLREPRSQRFALRVLALEVAGTGDDGARASLGPPAVADAPERWILVRPRGAGGSWSGADLSSALPVVALGGELELRVRGCGLEDVAVEGRVLDSDGAPVDAVEVRLEPRTGAQGGAGRVVVPAEADLSPGLYRLDLAAGSPGSEATVAQPFFLAPAGPRGDKLLVWTALGETTPATPGRPVVDPGDGETDAESAEVSAIVETYRRVLEVLAQGRREDAVDQLAALQDGLAEELEKPRRAASRLDSAQNRVTRQLLDHDPECLLPVVLLHLDLERRYRGSHDASPFLLEATRTRIRALAQVYAEESRSEMGRGLAALSLVEMAEALEQAQQRVSALMVLRDALALDPANPEVLLDLAFQFENHGFDGDAMTMLERLLELEPRSDEGRLRYAMNLRRADRHAEASEQLRRLIRDGDTEWVLAVAYEELGHLLIREERYAEAIRLLREGTGRFPRVQRVGLVLGYALDRAGERAAAREVLAALPVDGGRPSPRLRYRVPAGEEERRSREVLVRHATARLPLLGQALAASEGSR